MAQFESPDEDRDLLLAAQAAREGDLRAFEQLVVKHQRRILADCRYLTRDEANSEDLAQEVFVKAYFHLGTFEGKSTFRHWLQRIKVHHCLNHIKKRDGKASISIDDESVAESAVIGVAPEAASRMERADQRARIAAVLQALPATLRVPLIMRDMDELSYEEIAAGLHIGLSAAKMRIKRAREQFRKLYEGGPA